MFVSISNHPSANWPKTQRDSALALGGGELREIALPTVTAAAKTADVIQMAATIAAQVPDGATAMVVGEYSLVYSITARLRARGIRVLVPCHERVSSFELQPDGSAVKTSVFVFEGWREVE